MRIIVFLFLCFGYLLGAAQPFLTVDESIQIALRNNYDIQIAQNSANMAANNNTPGNAGMLPTISAKGSGSYDLNNVHMEYSGGTEANFPELSATAINAGVELNWTLFDGGKMFVTKSKLSEIEALGEIRFKDQVLNTLFDVISAYYDIVRQKQQLISINELMSFSQERLKISQAGYTAGSLIKQDVIQARIDLNIAMQLAINQQFVIDAAKRNLNEILNLPVDNDFEVSDSIPNSYRPDREFLISRIDSLNTSILASKKEIDIARFNMKEFNRLYSPVINLGTGYSLSQFNYSEGNTLLNSSKGPYIGGSFVIPLYSAGETKRKVSGAKIQLMSAEYEFESVKLKAYTELRNALTDFENQQKLLEIETENNALTRENLEISIHRLRLGQTTSLEVHQAQEYFVQSGTRLINFQYNLKIAEIRLKQLVSDL